MSKRTLRSAFLSVTAAATLVLASASAASANPTPDNGPETGGTVVTVPAPAGVKFTQVSSGYKHTLALGSDGHTYAWGGNEYGELGIGTTVQQLIPTQVPTPGTVKFVSISAGHHFSLALGDDGNTYGWGANETGQLGIGANPDPFVPEPTPVQMPAGVVSTRSAPVEIIRWL